MQNNWVNFSKAAFLPYARFFRSQKGGGAWPKWPNGKYAYGYYLLTKAGQTLQLYLLAGKTTPTEHPRLSQK